MYTEYFLIEIALFIFALEAVTHYIFTRNETFLLVVKEDLIMSILWRAATNGERLVFAQLRYVEKP